MARQTPDGLIRVYWVTTLSSMTAPTLVQVAAGQPLHTFLAPAGISLPDEGSEADSSDLSSERDKSVPSTVSGNPEGEFWRDDTADSAWTTLTRGATGYLVVALFGGTGTAGALAVPNPVDIWPARVSSRNLTRPARGEALRFTAVFALSHAPYYQIALA